MFHIQRFKKKKKTYTEVSFQIELKDKKKEAYQFSW